MSGLSESGPRLRRLARARPRSVADYLREQWGELELRERQDLARMDEQSEKETEKYIFLLFQQKHQ